MKENLHNNSNRIMHGYFHPTYPEAFSEFGYPIHLPQCGGWILQRNIPDFNSVDGMGCYPIFSCQDWSGLQSDLEELEKKLITLVLVTDPFGDFSLEYLEQCFPDFLIPFKQHFVTDLSIPKKEFVSNHHDRNARKGLQNLNVEVCQDPLSKLDDWIHLYDVLIERHHIQGITAFSAHSFRLQMQVPGMVVFRAFVGDLTVGMLLWYQMGNVAYYHLGAYNQVGYDSRASFALFSLAIDYFLANGVRWLSLGAGAGTLETEDDGLSRFKKGWSTGKKTAYLCGRVFDHRKYDEITRSKGIGKTAYFPAYRQGEFG